MRSVLGEGNAASVEVTLISHPSMSRGRMAPLLPPAQSISKLITRSDDTEEVVKERLRIYNDMES